MDRSRYFRVGMMFYGAILAFVSLWLLVAEFVRPGLVAFPANRELAESAAAHRNMSLLAARVGWLRGDLWTELALTYANLEWENGGGANAGLLQAAKENLVRAVSLRPADPSVWLLLADFARRYQWRSPDAVEAIKMSYYTGPEEKDLIPTRLSLSAQLDAATDPELERLFTQQVEAVLTSEPNFKSALIAAYGGGTPANRHLIEDMVKRYDPSFAQSLRGGAAQ